MEPMLESRREKRKTSIRHALVVFRQSIKNFIGVASILLLSLVNKQVDDVLRCISSLNKADSSLVPKANCSSYTIHKSLNIRVEYCHNGISPVTAFYLDSQIFRVYSGNESLLLHSWLGRCSGAEAPKACHIYTTPPALRDQYGLDCPKYSDLNRWDRLCFTDNLQLKFFVLDGFRLSSWETLEMIKFLSVL